MAENQLFDAGPSSPRTRRDACSVCGAEHPLRKDGMIRAHVAPVNDPVKIPDQTYCAGSRERPWSARRYERAADGITPAGLAAYLTEHGWCRSPRSWYYAGNDSVQWWQRPEAGEGVPVWEMLSVPTDADAYWYRREVTNLIVTIAEKDGVSQRLVWTRLRAASAES